MKNSSRGIGVKPTSRTVREIRAEIVLQAIVTNPELVDTIDDVRRLPRLTGWTDPIYDAAIDDLVSSGRLVEAADGRLCVVKGTA